jgi:stearoyl-CoA desaturase (delta-9 desaturase)
MLNGLKTTLLFFDIQRGQSVEYLKKYSVDYADDYTTNFPRIGKLCFLIFNTVLFGITGIILYITFHLVVSLITVVIIDIGGHTVGYRNFKLNNKSTNLPLFGLLGGEELHHNHHRYPGRPKYSTKWYEVDSGWAWIYLLSKCKLAKVK